MDLPWFRMDTDVYVHDKVLELVRIPRGLEAFAVYVFAIAWSAGQGTDGRIPAVALPVIHATTRHVNALVTAGLWETDGDGWLIHNYAGRQRLAQIEGWRDRGRKGAKARWGDDASKQ